MASQIEPSSPSTMASNNFDSSSLNSPLDSSHNEHQQSPEDHLASLSITDAAISAGENCSGDGDRGEERENSEEIKHDNDDGEVVVDCDNENDSTVKIDNNEVEEREKVSNRRRKGGVNNGVSSGGGLRFPVRPEAEDCSYYVRTGSCKFGMNCKFNHPPNHVRRPQGAKVKAEEFVDSGTPKVKEKDESVDKEQIDCKYFDRPGGCKFGNACKFNHSRKVNSTCKLNFMGLPIRPGEKECPFYMRNGSCKFGANCRFNHPEPSSMGGSDALPRYNNGGSVFSPNTSQSTHSTWSPPAPLNENSPYVPLMFPPTQGAPAQPEWKGYQAPLYPPERSMHMPPAYSMNNKLPERPEQMVGEEFPERPGQPECSYYVKTGTCKYKSACKFHHPKSAMPQSPLCRLSDLGLPLRPGENVCSYYSRYGICKYGPACKYDHPINHVHTSDLNVTDVNQAPVGVDSMVNNQAVVAGS